MLHKTIVLPIGQVLLAEVIAPFIAAGWRFDCRRQGAGGPAAARSPRADTARECPVL